MDLWYIEEGFNKENIPFYGNKFLIGNGYFGVRGTLEEYTKEQMCAVNLSGIYDKVENAWRESVNAPNPLHTYIIVNGKTYSLPKHEPRIHTQKLDFKNAVHSRETVWETDDGEIKIICERFASMSCHHIIGMKYSIQTEFDCEIEIVTGIDGDVWDINGPHFKEMKVNIESTVKSVQGITGENEICVKTEQYVDFDFIAEREIECQEKSIYEHIFLSAIKGEKYTFSKIASVTTSKDEEYFGNDISCMNYEEEKSKHICKWEEIWDSSCIQIEGDDKAMKALNYSIYHLNCIAPRNVKSRSIAARGLSGQVYKGAVFWDTEMFMLDYFIHTEPETAKTLIRYRIDTLEGAREKAREYNLSGAYYAWESQEGGFEACSDYNVVDVFTKRPMRTHFRDKQYHISAAVVYGIYKYINATEDYEILAQGGAEVIIECARMYRSLLIKKADNRCYEIHDVVGPDEYHERVNNNAYTNRMAKLVFEVAIKTADVIKNDYSDCYNQLNKKYNLESLLEKFIDSSQKIYIPSPNEDDIIEQFDGYFKLEDTSVDTVRNRILDPKEYWGGAYGVASQTQVIKQADVVAMLGIFGEEYSGNVLRQNFEYYEPRTEHGSSLSACMYSLLACKNGNADIAYKYFMKSAQADLLPGGKEWAGLIYIGGTHPASAGGSWIVAVKGFAGIEFKDGRIECKPSMPKGWESMRFKIRYMGKLYQVEIDKNGGRVSAV